MATCSLSTLWSSACANGFDTFSSGDKLNIALALVYSWSGSSATLAQLFTSACANGFTTVAESPDIRMTLALQMLCDISGGI